MTTTAEVSNRWSPFLAEHADIINPLSVGGSYLWHLTALMVEKHYRPGDYVLELGCGPGDSTVPVITRPFTDQMSEKQFHLVDSSDRALRACMRAMREKKYIRRASFFEEDALEFLRSRAESFEYGVIYTAWMLHNFDHGHKRELLTLVNKHLRPGGTFILMDKVYPQDKTESRDMLDRQRRRYRLCLPPNVADAICEHETEDYHPDYRMDEASLASYLESIGFATVEVIDRVERDCVIVCTK